MRFYVDDSKDITKSFAKNFPNYNTVTNLNFKKQF